MKKGSTVLIADDHQLFVEGIRRILEPEFDVVGSVGDGRSLVDRVTSSSCPDAILIDIAMPLLNGIEAVRQLRKAGCRAKLVVLTMHADTEFASEALSAGADGFVLKHCAPEEILTCLREVMLGRQYVAAQLADAMLEATQGRAKKSVQNKRKSRTWRTSCGTAAADRWARRVTIGFAQRRSSPQKKQGHRRTKIWQTPESSTTAFLNRTGTRALHGRRTSPPVLVDG